MVTREEFKAATERGKQMLAKYPTAVAAEYSPSLGMVIINLSNGHGFLLNPERAQGLEHASEDDLKEIEILGVGFGLHWPRLDADHYLPALLEGKFGSRKWAAAQLGKAGGSVKSHRKSAAARVNGKLGGRPKKAREVVA